MEKTKIGYLGPVGTFTEVATKTAFPKDDLYPCKTIPDCMEGVLEGEIDYCVVPIENAIEGSVNLTVDYIFHERALPIVAEVVVPIKQHLMVHPQQIDEWQNIKKVHSHPQAISQCHHFLKDTLPDAERVFENSTASAAKWIKDHPEECLGAIGNESAAALYGLKIINWDVHDYENNHTRFVVLSCKHAQLALDHTAVLKDKTTMTITLPSNLPGALHQVLSAFVWRQINLSKVESRPTKTGLGNYFFIIDADMKMDEILIPGVKAELEALGCKVNIIGTYPCYGAKNKLKKVLTTD
ncbi:prephenate dehydratase [Virgibacillus necropolis]|uniref:prephenate dehydratase n=1 Tax=Virgibacillus necropolis TaxID=163877 RepID=UPI00384B1443